MSQMASKAGRPFDRVTSFTVTRAVGAPAADAEHLVQPVGDELVADAARVVAAAGDAPLGALDAVLGERRGELPRRSSSSPRSSWCCSSGACAPMNDEGPALTMSGGPVGLNCIKRACRSLGSGLSEPVPRTAAPGGSRAPTASGSLRHWAGAWESFTRMDLYADGAGHTGGTMTAGNASGEQAAVLQRINRKLRKDMEMVRTLRVDRWESDVGGSSASTWSATCSQKHVDLTIWRRIWAFSIRTKRSSRSSRAR